MDAEDIPQSWAERSAEGPVRVIAQSLADSLGRGRAGYLTKFSVAIVDALKAKGYRLIRDDEATVERVASAIYPHGSWHLPDAVVPWTTLEERERARRKAERALAALIAAQGGEDG